MTEIDQRVDELIKEWREVGAGYSPAINRLRHMTNAEADAAVEGDLQAEQFLREQRYACHCYPHGFVSAPRAVKEQMKAEHIKAGVHSIGCPMWVDPNPMYSRAGDSAPSYTLAQRRRDAEAEALDHSRGPGRFRQGD